MFRAEVHIQATDKNRAVAEKSLRFIANGTAQCAPFA